MRRSKECVVYTFYFDGFWRHKAMSPATFTKKGSKKCEIRASLGIAMMERILVPSQAAQVQLLGRKRRRGRKPLAAPAWERMAFALDTPRQHPQQEAAILLGPHAAIQLEGVGADLAAEFV